MKETKELRLSNPNYSKIQGHYNLLKQRLEIKVNCIAPLLWSNRYVQPF
jgi:hypothetical protein